MSSDAIKVLFICMGNICRSPAAEGILKHLSYQYPSLMLHVESCGIGGWYVGSSPDIRMQQAAKARGIVLISVAKQFKDSYFEEFDYLLAADKEVLRYLYHYAKTAEQKAKIYLMTEFSLHYQGQEIPDPFYQGEGEFELVLDMLEDACQGLLEYLKSIKTY